MTNTMSAAVSDSAHDDLVPLIIYVDRRILKWLTADAERLNTERPADDRVSAGDIASSMLERAVKERLRDRRRL